MRVAYLPSTGPFFVEDLTYRKMMSWARGNPSPAAADFKLIVLTGPIKSGKTKLLEEVLSGVLAAEHATSGGPTPVIFMFRFTLGEGPQAAALSLIEAAAAKAKDLGFELTNVPTTGALALTALPRIMKNLADGIASAGGQLVLLIDEAQVRHGPLQIYFSP